MTKKRNLWIGGLLGCLLIVLAACGGNAAPKVDWELKVNGEVSQELNLSYSDLAAMPQTDLSDVLMEKSLGEDETSSWSGVAIEEIFNQAGVGEYGTIVAIAADGYAIEISKDEMQGAIVAMKKGDAWIPNVSEEDGKGPIRLVCPKTPANRWVFQLQELQVTAGAPMEVALKLNGAVKGESAWSAEQIHAMTTMEVEYENKEGTIDIYTGVSLNDLLDVAGPEVEATTLVLVADDGYSAEVDLEEVRACATCIVAFADDGGFTSIFPGFPGNTRVKGLVEIQVK